MDLSTISIGLPGATDRAIIRAIAPRIESLGFRALWLNDTPDGDSLAGLAVAAEVTGTLMLATGVIPLDRRPASAIAKSLDNLDLPQHRVELGIGAGGPANALSRVATAVSTLRDVTRSHILVGALGPRMRRLAAEVADAALFNWLTPDAASAAMHDLRRDSAGRTVRGVLYARTAVEPAALPALADEAARYESYPSYAANFERIGARAIDTTIDGVVPGALVERAAEYTHIVDELVLRVVTADASLDAYSRFVESVATA